MFFNGKWAQKGPAEVGREPLFGTLLASKTDPGAQARFGMHFCRLWLHFGFPFGSLCFPLASLWLPLPPFWLPLGSLWLPFGSLGSLLAPFESPLTPFWLPWPPFWLPFPIFWLPLASISIIRVAFSQLFFCLQSIRRAPAEGRRHLHRRKSSACTVTFQGPGAGICRRQLRSTLGATISAQTSTFELHC